MDKKIQQLQWLLDNIADIEIVGIYPDGYTGTPTLLVELKDWDKARESDFEEFDSCILLE